MTFSQSLKLSRPQAICTFFAVKSVVNRIYASSAAFTLFLLSAGDASQKPPQKTLLARRRAISPGNLTSPVKIDAIGAGNAALLNLRLQEIFGIVTSPVKINAIGADNAVLLARRRAIAPGNLTSPAM